MIEHFFTAPFCMCRHSVSLARVLVFPSIDKVAVGKIKTTAHSMVHGGVNVREFSFAANDKKPVVSRKLTAIYSSTEIKSISGNKEFF